MRAILSARPQLPLIALAAATSLTSIPAQASEGGASLYLLGSGGPGAAMLPPLEGVFFDNTGYYYHGKANGDREFVVGGNVVAGLEATIIADFPTVLWVPSTDVLGGTLALGATAVFGRPEVKVDATLTGPGGGQISLSAKDHSFEVADPVLSGSLSWTVAKNLHVAALTQLNIPIGHYREGALANLSLHRWAADASLALTWHDAEAGWDVSTKAGLIFNGTNHFTDYNTGTEFHWEGAVERTFSPAFSAGIQAFHLQQLSGDSGPGASLGSFKGRVSGIGATAAVNFMLGKAPANLRLRVLKEFDAKNRLEGTIGFLSLNFPISMKMPPAAAE